jgi:hypothetical protein
VSQVDPVQGIESQMKALLPTLQNPKNSAQHIQASRQWAALKAQRDALKAQKAAPGAAQPPAPSGVVAMPAPSGGGELGQKTPGGKKAPTKTGLVVPPPPNTGPSLVPQMIQGGNSPAAQMQGGSDQFGPAQEGEVEFVRGGRRYRMPMEAFQALFNRGGGAQQTEYEEQ